MKPSELAEWMRQHEMNVKKLAPELGVAERTLYAWLSGDRHIPKMAVKLLRLIPMP